MSVLITSESIPPTALPPVCSDSQEHSSVDATDILLTSVGSAQIVVSAEAHTVARRKRKNDIATDSHAEVMVLQRNLQEEKQRNTIHRAAAEQSRRVADCQLAFQKTLIEQMDQPCFSIDIHGAITLWNPAMVRWTDCPSAAVLSVPLAQIIGTENAEHLIRACRLAQVAIENGKSSPHSCAFTPPELFRLCGNLAAQITLIPQCRIPGCIEAFVILISK